jgi:hypothetical protein
VGWFDDAVDVVADALPDGADDTVGHVAGVGKRAFDAIGDPISTALADAGFSAVFEAPGPAVVDVELHHGLQDVFGSGVMIGEGISGDQDGLGFDAPYTSWGAGVGVGLAWDAGPSPSPDSDDDLDDPVGALGVLGATAGVEAPFSDDLGLPDDLGPPPASDLPEPDDDDGQVADELAPAPPMPDPDPPDVEPDAFVDIGDDDGSMPDDDLSSPSDSIADL